MKALIVVEHKDGTVKNINFEIATMLRKLGNIEIHAILLGKDLNNLSQKLSEYGVSSCICAESPELVNYSQDKYASVIATVVKEKGYTAVFGGTSPFGKDLLPRVAAKLDAGMISDVVSLEKNGEKLIAKKPHFSGKCLSKAEVLSSVGVYSVRPNSIKAEPSKAEMKTETYLGQIPKALSEVKELQAGKSAKADLTEATYIVSGGRAMGNADNFKILHELAEVIGATVGASRAAVDSGYAPHNMQVGQTGKTVNPVLYMACGISGAIQHLAGMRTSKVIVAINKDGDAPIFSRADYGVVGDLFQIVPHLTQEFKKLLGK